MARPSKISVATVKRNQRFRGPGLSAQQNDMQDELIRDITEIQAQHNNFTVPLTSLLPDGTTDSNVDAFRNGLDGQTLFVHAGAVNNAALSRYYNVIRGRPNTTFEQFQDAYNYVNSSITTLEETVLAAATSGGLTTAQKERIGLNVFDETLASGPTSLDGKTNKNELNIVQLARDMYGASFVSFSIDGTGILAAPVRTMVDALLEQHNGNWDDDTTLAHTLDASEIVSGTFLQSRVGASSGAPAGVNDSYVGTPGDTVDDLNQLRTLLKNLKGTLAFSTAITPDGTWSAVTPAPTSFQNLISLKGTGTRSNSNPWGLDYSDIGQLSSILSAENSYTGRTGVLDSSPVYSYTIPGFNSGDALVDAISVLASGLNTVTTESSTTTSGLAVHLADLANPHVVTLTQAATAGGSAPAAQIDIVDIGSIYTSANVEDALQEIAGIVTTTSGIITAYVDAADAILTADIATVAADLVTASGALDARLTSAESELVTLDTRVDIVELYPTSDTFRRQEFTIDSLASLSGLNLVHSAGMYPQVQIINELPGPYPYVEPVSQVSGVWIEHIDDSTVTLTNYTGTTISGIAVVQW
jgi:hypothetical protein